MSQLVPLETGPRGGHGVTYPNWTCLPVSLFLLSEPLSTLSLLEEFQGSLWSPLVFQS